MSLYPRVTYVGHDGSRTGAPLLMASMLRWIVEGEHGKVRVVVQRRGPLICDYRHFAETQVVERSWIRVLDQGLTGIGSLTKREIHRSWLWRLGARGKADSDIVVVNTLAALRLGVEISTSTTRLVCHIHELDHVAERVLGSDRRARRDLDRVDRFVATGPAVYDMLVERWGIERSRVSTVNAFIDESALPQPQRNACFESHPPLVVAVGAMRRRKGPDRFIELMGLIADHPSRPEGLWVGGDVDSAERHETLSDIERAGLGGRVRLLGSVENPLEHIVAADVLVSMSREDPFPLVALEAGAMGVPVVGTDAGGLGYILRSADLSQSVVPPGDLFKLAGRLEVLLENPGLRRDEGKSLQSWVLQNCTITTVAPALWTVITT